MKLTKETLTKLSTPAGKNEVFFWDDDLPCFAVRLRGKTARYAIQYRIGHKQRRESLGDIRKIKLEDARAIARRRFAEVELGVDPVERLAKLKAEQKITFKSVVERYLAAKEGKVAASTFAQLKLHLQSFFKAFDNKAITAITRGDIASELQTITKDRGRSAAAKARVNLSGFYTWAMKEGLADIPANPVAATNDPGAGIVARDRVLSDAELAIIWKPAKTMLSARSRSC